LIESGKLPEARLQRGSKLKLPGLLNANRREAGGWGKFVDLERLLGGESRAVGSVNVHVNDFASGFHDVTGGTVVLEKRVFNILPIHYVRDFTISKVTFSLLKYILEERIGLKKALVIAKALSYFVSFADVYYLQLLVHCSRNAVNSRILCAVKGQTGFVIWEQL